MIRDSHVGFLGEGRRATFNSYLLHVEKLGKFGSPVSSEQGGKTPRAVLTAVALFNNLNLSGAVGGDCGGSNLSNRPRGSARLFVVE
jgi:hypothetical protein